MMSIAGRRVEVKICGLTQVEEAERCVQLGADAVGCVFFPKSPRHVSDIRAASICRAVAGRAATIGVFVDEPFDRIMKRVDRCRLSGVQLHGRETPSLVRRLADEGLLVIKALFDGGKPGLEDAGAYEPVVFLVECAKGPLPGGNAIAWDWGAARPLGSTTPLILAGGLSDRNVVAAIAAALPSAVDVSSGVERSPGRKDIEKVAAFIAAVQGSAAAASHHVFKIGMEL